MITGLYSASTALQALQRNQEVIAHNLAHVGVPGYRGLTMTFGSLESASEQDSSGIGAGSTLGQESTDFTQGPIVHTGRKLDVAIDGDGFFVLQGQNEQLFTRNGVFFLADDGTFINSEGMPVLGTNGPLRAPAGSSESQIDIARDGTVTVGESPVGQLRIASFTDNQQLERAGTTLFRAPPGVAPDDANSQVRQGVHEQANVSAVDQLVRMVTGIRQYEAAQRVLKTIDQTIGSQTNPQQA
jgi:flagellar basal body rod protein FlgG